MKRLLLPLLFATLLFAGCEIHHHDHPQPQPDPYIPPTDPATLIDPTFPLQPGLQWTYETEISVASPSSTSYEYVDTRLTVDGRVSLPDGRRAFALVHEDAYADGSVYVNEQYVENYREGLHEIGHTEGEQRVIMKAPTGNAKAQEFKWNGQTFTSLAELRKRLHNGRAQASGKTTQTIFIYDQPQLMLAYPAATGLWWETNTKTNFGEWSRKEVVGVQDIIAPWGTERCLKVAVQFDFDREGIYEPGTLAYQYWNHNGLVQLVYQTDIVVVDPVTGFEEPATYRESVIPMERSF